MRLISITAVVVVLGLGAACQSHSGLVNHLRPADRALMELAQAKRAEISFHARFGRYGTSQEIGPRGAGLLAEDVGKLDDWGYHFNLNLTLSGYTLTATPIHADAGADEAYYCDETGVLRSIRGRGPANALSNPVWVER